MVREGGRQPDAGNRRPAFAFLHPGAPLHRLEYHGDDETKRTHRYHGANEVAGMSSASQEPPPMKVVRQHTLGGPEVLEVAEVPRPTPIPTEVLVEVHAAGVNPVDWKTRERGAFLGEPPFILGWDVAGMVAEVGHGVTRFAIGDEVFGMPWFPRQAGCYGEYVTAPSRHFARKPAKLSLVEAAGLPLAGLTAWQALADLARLGAGQRLLVTAAAGGVGHLAVQIGKALGAQVIGTASAAKHDFLRSLGADETIDYTTGGVAEAVLAGRSVDVALDLVGRDNPRAILPAVKPGGLLIAVTGGLSPELAAAAAEREVRTSGILVEPDYAGLEALAALVEEGKLRVHVDRTFPLEQAADAHRLSETGHVTGKLVLTVH